MHNHSPSKKRTTAQPRRLVPCDVRGVPQTWVLTGRGSGLLTIRPYGEPDESTLDRRLLAMIKA